MQTSKRQETTGVQAVRRAGSILEAIVHSPQPLRLKELAEVCDQPMTSVHRLVTTLQSMGYVTVNEFDGTFGVGLRLVDLGGAALQRSTLLDVSGRVLPTLAATTHETVNLAVRQGQEALYVDKVESTNALRLSIPVGRRAPIHCSAVGKVLVAEDPLYIAPLHEQTETFPAYTARTITDPQELARHLDRVAAQGYAVDDEEQIFGVRCVACPVRDHTGRVIAAVSVSGTTMRILPERIPEVAAIVGEHALLISRHLGYQNRQAGAR